jgi:transposase-like protein
MADATFLSIMKWSDEECRKYLEGKRWPDGPHCPKCGTAEHWTIKRKSATKNVVKTLYRCKNKDCLKQYTATVGTIFEDSKIPLSKWFAAIYLMCASKKGVSAHQIHRELEVTYKSAWFMCHRIREAMREQNPALLSGIVEADETYIGGKPRGHMAHRSKDENMSQRIKRAWNSKAQVFGMVERGGRVRTMTTGGKGKRISQKQIQAELLANVDLPHAKLMTDEHDYYFGIERHLPHGVIRHRSEYVRGAVHTQSIESYWAILKRGLYGTFHHVDAGYLGQYLNEFEYRYNARTISDAERFSALMAQTQGRVTWFCQTPQAENPFA